MTGVIKKSGKIVEKVVRRRMNLTSIAVYIFCSFVLLVGGFLFVLDIIRTDISTYNIRNVGIVSYRYGFLSLALMWIFIGGVWIGIATENRKGFLTAFLVCTIATSLAFASINMTIEEKANVEVEGLEDADLTFEDNSGFIHYDKKDRIEFTSFNEEGETIGKQYLPPEENKISLNKITGEETWWRNDDKIRIMMKDDKGNFDVFIVEANDKSWSYLNLPL